VISGDIERRLKEIIHEVCGETRSEIIELETMSDHIHLLVEVDPQFGIHKVIKLIKGRSSHHLRQEFPGLKSRIPTLWTNAYFVSTVGGAPLAVIKRYIENQKNV
jgi:putative transposase